MFNVNLTRSTKTKRHHDTITNAPLRSWLQNHNPSLQNSLTGILQMENTTTVIKNGYHPWWGACLLDWTHPAENEDMHRDSREQSCVPWQEVSNNHTALWGFIENACLLVRRDQHYTMRARTGRIRTGNKEEKTQKGRCCEKQTKMEQKCVSA